MEEGDVLVASFFVKDLGLALAPKMCPDQSQAFKEVSKSQAFTVAEKKCRIIFSVDLYFLTSRLQVVQGVFVESFAQIVEELTP